MGKKEDLFGGCFEPGYGVNQTEFQAQFCKHCRNPQCIRAQNRADVWEEKINTNVDRLLINPKFSDLKAPAHLQIHRQEFKDISRRAQKLIISTQKGDWEPVSDEELGITSDNRSLATPEATKTVEEAVSKLAELTGKAPKPKVEVEQEALEKPPAKPEEPSQPLDAPLELSPSEMRRARQLEAETGLDRVPTPNPPRPPETPPSGLPHRRNTAAPPDGVMIDGSRPTRTDPNYKPPAPAVDPWAPQTVRKMTPGSKIVLGGGNGKK